ncbi:hypothetical protein C5Y96_02800 [Blastopirellula marina]|uniref:Uncharacterized protein n=1 Tax=Blastopirellula marina TaxID=124 RepID=A0A2S8G2Y5_9BACT|nr:MULTISPECIES: 2'-5' RNA ligase family protein [Pirellulaceae]PQO38815.1 hypothetical protein C5Y96_02800 [Blastopirellula marina]RCS55123.1 hypothetical protein DTL36_02805 [Bremerella cremea]
MTSIVTDFISIDPSPQFSRTINAYKQKVRELVGDQVFLNELPHMTAYLARFAKETDLPKYVANLAKSIPVVTIRTTGWHVFDADPMTGNRTLVVNFDEPSQNQLRSIQKQIGSALRKLYDQEATKQRYAEAWQHFTADQREAVELAGFPFWGSGWHPHFTIASISPTDWPAVAETLLPNPPSGEITCPSLTHYRVIDGDSHTLHTFDLQ